MVYNYMYNDNFLCVAIILVLPHLRQRGKGKFHQAHQTEA